MTNSKGTVWYSTEPPAYRVSMCSAVSRLPVADLGSDHRFSIMSEGSTPPQRGENNIPVRTNLPSREPSREDLELVQSLLGHSQSIRHSHDEQPSQASRSTPSPAYEPQSPMSTSPASDQMRQGTPRSDREQSYTPAPSIISDSVQSGQVCR